MVSSEGYAQVRLVRGPQSIVYRVSLRAPVRQLEAANIFR